MRIAQPEQTPNALRLDWECSSPEKSSGFLIASGQILRMDQYAILENATSTTIYANRGLG